MNEPHGAHSQLSAALTINPEYLGRFTTGRRNTPSFSSAFPARRITTALEWTDLILPAPVRDDVEEIVGWIRHQDTLRHQWRLDKKIPPGFRSVFYGPPGTGRTLTAALLGKATERDVYRVDLALVVSKWIGETEKNLDRVFTQAEAGDWILFFDEADALFGTRTNPTSANDRYSNQGVAYLLQRIEDFAGVVILASNRRGRSTRRSPGGSSRRSTSRFRILTSACGYGAAPSPTRVASHATSTWRRWPSSSRSLAAPSTTCCATQR